MELILKIALIVLPSVLFLALFRAFAKQRAIRDAASDELVLYFRALPIWLTGILGVAIPLSAGVLLFIFPPANNRETYLWIILAGTFFLVSGPISLQLAHVRVNICSRGIIWKSMFGKTIFLPWEDVIKVSFVRNFQGTPQTFWLFAEDRRKGELAMGFHGIKDAVPLLREYLPAPVQQKCATDLLELVAVTDSSSCEVPIEPTAPPISYDNLKSLFDYLDRPDPPPCDHTHKETIEFLKENGLPVVPTVAWLKANGGYCDCEVIYNVTDIWAEKVGWKPNSEEDE